MDIADEIWILHNYYVLSFTKNVIVHDFIIRRQSHNLYSIYSIQNWDILFIMFPNRKKMTYLAPSLYWVWAQSKEGARHIIFMLFGNTINSCSILKYYNFLAFWIFRRRASVKLWSEFGPSDLDKALSHPSWMSISLNFYHIKVRTGVQPVKKLHL